MPSHALFSAWLRVAAALVFALALALPGPAARAEPARGFIHAQGRHLVGPDDREFNVRGVNLGHWLVPQAHMFGFDGDTPRPQMRDLCARLLGEQEAEAFWQRFRDTFVTQDDIRFIAAAGFNTVRVPMD